MTGLLVLHRWLLVLLPVLLPMMLLAKLVLLVRWVLLVLLGRGRRVRAVLRGGGEEEIHARVELSVEQLGLGVAWRGGHGVGTARAWCVHGACMVRAWRVHVGCMDTRP